MEAGLEEEDKEEHLGCFRRGDERNEDFNDAI